MRHGKFFKIVNHILNVIFFQIQKDACIQASFANAFTYDI